MTTTTTTPTEPTKPTEDTSAPPAEPSTDDTGDRLAGEAARWRRTAREAEADRDAARAERDAALEQVASYRRAALDQTLGDWLEVDVDGRTPRVKLQRPADFWALTTTDPATLTSDDGTPDRDAIRAAVSALYAERHYLFEHLGGAIRRELRLSGGPQPKQGGGSDWAEALSRNSTR